ncbi:MAG: FtsX-like permease family protein [Candidatus Aminicenantes bacterium]|nr:FtsX-like permease family protein [Candidatus Aminicenantes bacterium]
MNKKPQTQSKWGRKFLFFLLPVNEKESLIGDFDEIFEEKEREKGKVGALIWYWTQIMLLVSSYIKESIYWSLVMIRNYLKIAFRNLTRHKGFSFINISGLAIGMLCAFLIFFWVKHELSFDRYNEKGESLYRVLQHIRYSEVVTWSITQGPLGPALKEEIPEVIEQARYSFTQWRIKHNDNIFMDIGGYTDPSLFKMFTLPFVQGDPDTALSDPRSVVLTQELAQKIFGSEDPMGKIINVADEYDFRVSGILKDLPDNTHFRFEFLANMDFAKERGNTVDYWKNSQFTTYVQLAENASMEEVNAKIYNFLDAKPTLEDWEKLSLQPLFKIHLSSGIGYDYFGTGNAKYIVIFSAVAFFVLLIACINFMNLSTARSLLRSREVGLRKVVGAFRSQLIIQFVGESVFHCLIALVMAVSLGILLLPAFNQLARKEFTPDIFLRPDVLLGCLVLVVFTGITAGIYPAFVLSGFRPVSVLKESGGLSGRRSLFRRVLVVFQFCVSVVLIIGSLVIFSQVHFMQNKDLGYNKENLITLDLNSNIQKNYEAFRNELLENQGILSVSRVHGIPIYGYYFSNSRWNWEGKDPEKDVLFRANFADYDYLETLGARIVQGRDFSEDHGIDASGDTIIINETAQKVMGFDDPIGKRVTLGKEEFHIIGVVKDFHYVSLHTQIEPLIHILNPDRYSAVVARISSEKIPQTLQFMEGSWKKYAGDYEFDFRFMDDRLDELYRGEQRVGRIINVFTALSVFISCLGLFGLASFMVVRKTKEIGIRKVLGASISGIVLLLTKEYSKWVIAANVIAWPLSYFILKQWLQQFPYRTDIKFLIFLGTGLVTLGIAVLTVSYQSIRAALSNPAESLRNE